MFVQKKKITYENFDLINLLITLSVALKFYYLWLTSSSITETSISNGMWRNLSKKEKKKKMECGGNLFEKVGLNSKMGS